VYFRDHCREVEEAFYVTSELLSWQLEFAGLKKYHIPVLDPLQVPEVKANDMGLDMVGRDIIAKGMRNIILKNIK
jgi:hypothetical protein